MESCIRYKSKHSMYNKYTIDLLSKVGTSTCESNLITYFSYLRERFSNSSTAVLVIATVFTNVTPLYR